MNAIVGCILKSDLGAFPRMPEQSLNHRELLNEDALADIKGGDLLTKREREVLAQLVAGASNKEAGRTLCISFRTIEVHRARIMEKLGARNCAELVRIALGQGPKH